MISARVFLAAGVALLATAWLAGAAHAAAVTSNRVDLMDSGASTYAGFITVNATTGANLFYYFFEAQSGKADAPFILWLQGGPGCTSLLAAFYECGPYRINDNLTLSDNPDTWATDYHLLFVDQPVMTGFSYVEDQSALVTTEEEMAAQMYVALTEFFGAYPQYAANDFYITGESYAGKYNVALGYYIHSQNELLAAGRPAAVKAAQPINMVGIAIGDGLTDPVTQEPVRPSVAYSAGLIDMEERNELQAMETKLVSLIEEEAWEAAAYYRDGTLDVLGNMTGGINILDYRTYGTYNFSNLVDYVNLAETRAKLGVGNHTFYPVCAGPAEEALHNDTMKSVKWMVPTLLDNYKVMLYQGQFDLEDGVASNQAWMSTLTWSGIAAFENATRDLWTDDDGNVLGYARQYSNLTHVIVHGAGHLVPMNQPQAALTMITNFVEGTPF